MDYDGPLFGGGEGETAPRGDTEEKAAAGKIKLGGCLAKALHGAAACKAPQIVESCYPGLKNMEKVRRTWRTLRTCRTWIRLETLTRLLKTLWS